jgi:hypothetical protein
MLRTLLVGPWSAEDFLVVPPGLRIAMGTNLTLRAEEA